MPVFMQSTLGGQGHKFCWRIHGLQQGLPGGVMDPVDDNLLFPHLDDVFYEIGDHGYSSRHIAGSDVFSSLIVRLLQQAVIGCACSSAGVSYLHDVIVSD
jgi:hypothetical protein